MRRRIPWLAGLAAMIGLSASAVTPESIVVVANRNVPASISLARQYMERRSIPETHLCVLDLPKGEMISRGDYVQRLRDPLLNHLRDHKLIDQRLRPKGEVQSFESAWLTETSRIDCVVSMYGVPVRIADTRISLANRITDRLGYVQYKNTAAVDSELALMLSHSYPLGGPTPNPLFRSFRIAGKDREREAPVLLACRLDGPSVDAVRHMINDVIDTERYGILGRVYVDSRGLRGGDYFMGDYWLTESYERLARMGYEGVLDQKEETWPAYFPMEQAGIYLGWYDEQVSGPFTVPGFHFQPGAVAYHIHSGSAAILRTKDQHWAGPLVDRGAAVTMGAVAEPFLQFTPQVNIFIERLLQGFSFVEAAYLSQNVLSWQITFIGDPLYRPFRYSLAEQLQHMEEDQHPGIEWLQLRQINRLVRDGRFNVALNYARACIRENDSLVLRERLGDLYAINDLHYEAALQYDYILDHASTAATAVRVGQRLMRLLEAMHLPDKVEEARAFIEEHWPDNPYMPWLDTP